MKTLFFTFPSHLLQCFRGYYLIFHFLAIAFTFVLVTSGFDKVYFESTQDAFLQSLLFPAVVMGALLPFIVPLVLYFTGLIRKHFRTTHTAFALAQAALMGWFISSLYKAFTGRYHPKILVQGTAPLLDVSREFQFGFLRGGIFWGWPSGHTTVAFAMAVTACYLYPENKFIRSLAIIYALYIGIGISTNIHWFSDFIAGAFIGTVIGSVVGKYFRSQYLSHFKKIG